MKKRKHEQRVSQERPRLEWFGNLETEPYICAKSGKRGGDLSYVFYRINKLPKLIGNRPVFGLAESSERLFSAKDRQRWFTRIDLAKAFCQRVEDAAEPRGESVKSEPSSPAMETVKGSMGTASPRQSQKLAWTGPLLMKPGDVVEADSCVQGGIADLVTGKTEPLKYRIRYFRLSGDPHFSLDKTDPLLITAEEGQLLFSTRIAAKRKCQQIEDQLQERQRSAERWNATEGKQINEKLKEEIKAVDAAVDTAELQTAKLHEAYAKREAETAELKRKLVEHPATTFKVVEEGVDGRVKLAPCDEDEALDNCSGGENPEISKAMKECKPEPLSSAAREWDATEEPRRPMPPRPLEDKAVVALTCTGDWTISFKDVVVRGSGTAGEPLRAEITVPRPDAPTVEEPDNFDERVYYCDAGHQNNPAKFPQGRLGKIVRHEQDVRNGSIKPGGVIAADSQNY